ncbi:ribosomal protein S7 domain-containing protein [Gloeopeniophorella convolvens]|nr:ribosomal protein S7 domain-containing protein [Gloeopeniophorella convolvens]
MATAMLSTLRSATRRSFPSLARPLATASSGVSQQNPLSALAASVPTPSSSSAVLAPAAAQTPALPFSTPGAPLVLDIPPAEDPLLQFMTNSIMRHGQRKRASRVVSRMLLWVHSLTRAPPLDIVRQAVLLGSPAVRSMSHSHGGKVVSRPIALSEKQRTRFAVKWILKASDKRPGQTLEERIAREIIGIIQGSSSVLDEKERAHTFAMVNRGNAETRV